MKKFYMIITLAILLFTGCASYSTLQTPETLERGDFSIGIGVNGIVQESEGETNSGAGIIDVFTRVGIAHNWDLGLKVTPYPPLLFTVFGDIKYRIVEKPIMISADMGTSVGIFGTGFYPMILLGNKNIYTGAKVIIFNLDIDSDDSWNNFNESFFQNTTYGILFGASLGERFKLMPEVNIYFNKGAPTFYYWTLGAQVTL